VPIGDAWFAITVVCPVRAVDTMMEYDRRGDLRLDRFLGGIADGLLLQSGRPSSETVAPPFHALDMELGVRRMDTRHQIVALRDGEVRKSLASAVLVNQPFVADQDNIRIIGSTPDVFVI